MILRSLLLLFVSIISAASQAQSDSLKASMPIDTTTYVYGNVMYEKGNYNVAISVYENLLATNGQSAQIYYNLGNAYFKINQIGKAVLNYERALFFDSNDNDTEYNLELANQRIRDKIEAVAPSIFELWWRAYISWFTSIGWSVIAILLIWIALGGFVIYRYERFIQFQREGFYVFLIALILFLFAFAAAAGRSLVDKNYQFAIVMSPSAVIKSEPSESSTNLFLIHEGLKLQLLNTESNWIEIEMPDGNIGWIKNEDIVPVNPFKPEQNLTQP